VQLGGLHSRGVGQQRRFVRKLFRRQEGAPSLAAVLAMGDQSWQAVTFVFDFDKFSIQCRRKLEEHVNCDLRRIETDELVDIVAKSWP
jgi:hypothetical protein